MNKLIFFYSIALMLLISRNEALSSVDVKNKIAKCYEFLENSSPPAIRVELNSPALQAPRLSKMHLIESNLKADSTKASKLPISVIKLDTNGHVIDQCLAVSSDSLVYDEIWQKSIIFSEFKPASKDGIPFVSLFVFSMRIHPR